MGAGPDLLVGVRSNEALRPRHRGVANPRHQHDRFPVSLSLFATAVPEELPSTGTRQASVIL